jgi:hypothetical protein
MSLLRVNTIQNRTGTDKVTFPFGIGVTNGIQVSGVITATSFVGSGISLTGVQGTITLQGPGLTNLSGITTINVGAGLTYNQFSTGIGSIGILPQSTVTATNVTATNARITGIATLSSVGLTTINSLGGGEIRAQGLKSLIRQSFETRAELTSQLAADYHGAIAHTHDDAQIYLARVNGVWDRLVKENHTAGIITSSNGFSGNLVGNVTGNVTGNITGNITGNVNSTGVSNIAYLQATTIKVATAATVATDLTVERNLNVSGGIVGNIFSINNSGVSTISYLQGTNINITGILTAASVNASGTITNSTFSQVANYAGIATTVTLVATNTTSANHFITFVDTATGNENVRTDTDLTYNPGANLLTAGWFSGRVLSTHINNTGVSTFSGNMTLAADIIPDTNNIRNLGSDTVRWANIYANDMHLSNKGGSNSVDGTWGDWTLQEGENDIFMLNNRTGKKFKISMTEVS